jgi:hypothetical protein
VRQGSVFGRGCACPKGAITDSETRELSGTATLTYLRSMILRLGTHSPHNVVVTVSRYLLEFDMTCSAPFPSEICLSSLLCSDSSLAGWSDQFIMTKIRNPWVLLVVQATWASTVLSQLVGGESTFGTHANVHRQSTAAGAAASTPPDYTCSATKGCDLGCCGPL